jgi:hypothetical protein
LGIDNDGFLLLSRWILKKEKSMVTMSFNEVEEAIDVTFQASRCPPDRCSECRRVALIIQPGLL